MTKNDACSESADAGAAQSEWMTSARLMPSPHTASEKAAIAASLYAPPVEKALTKSRIAIGTAAAAVAVAVPSVSLEAMVDSLRVGPLELSPLAGPQIDPQPKAVAKTQLPTEVWTPAVDAAGPVYAQTLALADAEATFSSRTRISEFERELPLTVLDGGSEAFDLAFANVEAPIALTAIVSGALPDDPRPISQTRSTAIATRNIAIEQITDLKIVARATPENTRPRRRALAANSSSVRTNAIANRSVEAAFAGAIDASNAVRSSLPIAPDPRPNPVEPRDDEVRRAIPAGTPSPEVSATAAAEAMLVPKTKLDARVNGVLTGSVDFRQLDGTIAIRLRSIANMMRERFSKTELSHIMKGQAIDSFVPLAQLQAAGIPVSYNPAYDEVEFGIDYQDAPNAKKVHVDQISVAPIGPELTTIEQIPR